MQDMIGISEDRLHHIIGVARACYKLAKDLGYDENFCKRMFMIGWNHDVGYEFVSIKEAHSTMSEQLLQLINVTGTDISSQKVRHAVRKHSQLTTPKSAEWWILSIADLTIDSKGNKVSINERLKDIEERYGTESEQYSMASYIVTQLNFTSNT